MSGEINQASLKLIQNRIDLDQIVDKGANPSAIVLIFRNDDRIVLTWRDQAEREACSKNRLPKDDFCAPSNSRGNGLFDYANYAPDFLLLRRLPPRLPAGFPSF
jgi:hypothetical protein